MPLFTANLKKAAGTYPGRGQEPRGKAAKHQNSGKLQFRIHRHHRVHGVLSFINVNATQGFWQFESGGFSVGTGAPIAAPHQAIADTGTTLLMLPAAVAEAYYAQVKSATNDARAGGFVFSCSEQLPDLTLDIEASKAVVPGELINFAPVDTNSFATAKSCFGGIQASQGLPFAIYGDIFLKSQFVVFPRRQSTPAWLRFQACLISGFLTYRRSQR